MTFVAGDDEISAGSNGGGDDLIIGWIMLDDAGHAGGFHEGHHGEIGFDQLLSGLIDHSEIFGVPWPIQNDG